MAPTSRRLNREAAFPTRGSGFASLRGSRGARRASVLAYVAVLMFVLFGVVALVVDLGMARSSYSAMNGAARSGAMEGLRQRDNLMVDARVEARDIVSLHFDNTSWGTTGQRFGAGPGIEFQSDGQLQEFALTDLSAVAPFQPQLQLNDGTLAPLNERHGDMLTGTYDPAASHRDHVGDVPYLRDDFVPAGVGEVADSFLLRLRRTYDPTGLDSIEGVSSRGLSVPFIWGRGALVFQDDPLGYDPRRDGISVMARAIADAQPAMSVGPANPAFGVAGLAPFAIRYEFWEALPVGVPTPVILTAGGGMGELALTPILEDARLWGLASLDGAISDSDTLIDVSSSNGFPDPPFQARIGTELVFVTDVLGTQWTVERGVSDTAAVAHGAGDRVVSHEVSVVGDGLDFAPADQLFLPGPGEAFVPIYRFLPPFERRVVGYGRARLEDLLGVGPPYSFPTVVFITREGGQVAHENASAVASRAIDPSLTPLGAAIVFASRGLVSDPIEAPALVRAHGN